MNRRFFLSPKFAAVFTLVLVCALSVAWANNFFSNNVIVSYGAGGWFDLVSQGQDKIRINIPNGSLDDYLDEQLLPLVNITCDLEEEWVDTGGGTGYYRLDFTFGPSGAFFAPDKLELELRGKYFTEDIDVTLVDVYGEELEWTRHGNSDKITYYIPHFSNYYYEGYY